MKVDLSQPRIDAINEIQNDWQTLENSFQIIEDCMIDNTTRENPAAILEAIRNIRFIRQTIRPLYK